MGKQKKYKDTIFRMLFTDPADIRQLYNALGNTNYGDDVPVEIKTIQDTAYADIKNDLAFTIDNKFVVMVEHQSTINKNMPFRMLRYFERIMRVIYPMDKIYKERIIKFPTPEFYVLYNGPKDLPEETVWKLSDAFIEEAKENSIELVVKVVNVRYNKDVKILNDCKVLREYSIFIDKIENHILKGCSRKEAIEKALNECVAGSILKDFLTAHRAEVIDGMYGDISFEEFLKIREQEQYEIGCEDGEKRGRAEGIRQGIRDVATALKNMDFPISDISKVTGLDEQEIKSL